MDSINRELRAVFRKIEETSAQKIGVAIEEFDLQQHHSFIPKFEDFRADRKMSLLSSDLSPSPFRKSKFAGFNFNSSDFGESFSPKFNVSHSPMLRRSIDSDASFFHSNSGIKQNKCK